MATIKQILVATDFSPCAQAALDLAVDLAKGLGASVLLLNVYEVPAQALPVYALPDGTVFNLDAETIERMERSIDEQLHAEQRRVARPEIDLAVERADGAAAEVIVRYAEAKHSDLVVLGTHGRKGLKRLLLGSVAEQVLRTAPCPVLIVREGAVAP